jgi:preprotein translocase subunit SecE
VASRNRRGRDVEDDGVDEPIEDEYDDTDLDDSDVEEFDELEEEEDAKPSRRSRAGTATRTRAVRRTRTEAPGILGWLVRRFRETVAELQKVIWPTRKELLTYTSVVVVFVALIMSIVAGLDTGFAKLMFAVFGKNQ